MSDFLNRLNTESAELKDKTNKLESFINSDNFNGIDWVQRDLLEIQLQAMKTYSKCLDKRIYRLELPQESI